MHNGKCWVKLCLVILMDMSTNVHTEYLILTFPISYWLWLSFLLLTILIWVYKTQFLTQAKCSYQAKSYCTLHYILLEIKTFGLVLEFKMSFLQQQQHSVASILLYNLVSMTQLLSHTFAHLTGSSFRLKAKLLSIKNILGVKYNWVNSVKKWPSF